jgi:hypothetical protein
MKVTAHTKEELIRKFIEKLDYSYNYKTVNERQSIINDICEIAGIEQLNIPVVVGQSEQILAWERWKIEKGNYPEYRTQEQMIKDYLSQ